ncbi:GDSL-type esterase/lipase family protein [Streptomyces cylindrosporus]|uniref:GDSL-type esterase/lipase family protein n=1 Tax=Streptomyces cylindrosporus TaxID=2927583 RepID=A0ABS9Y097_9ACTN|nr:GDSL-type esterase/lipase family protein [Streptomyces cylindrosporus]MCI3270449.1 GDSL-type esterase/lipase family protein [Streptomyces cylindrosporus]
MTTTWIAAHRSAVINPYEGFGLFEPRGFTDRTVRQSLRLAGGGDALRIRLSNRYGKEPIRIGGAHLAVRTRGSGIDPGSDTPLRFSGAETVTVPVGEELVSDPVELPVSAGEELTVSLYLPGDTGLSTYTAVPYDLGYAVPGERLSAELLEDAEELSTGHYLTGVDVLAPADTRIAVAFGDSWVEGAFTTPGADNSFPARLSRRLTRGWIVNQGISGNRLLSDEVGEHLLARVDRDVLAVPGVSHVLIHIGLNDIGLPGARSHPEPPTDRPSAEDLVTGLTALADRLHAAGLVAIGGTLGPYEGCVYDGVDSPEGQAVRREVNAWLLGDAHPFDAVIDIAAAVADPEQPTRIRAEFNAGDGLHVNDAGAKAIADAVDVTLLDL